jgi:glycosyltransferase involved in cell wall biosynthesis
MEKVVETLAGLQSQRGLGVSVVTSDVGYTKEYVDPYPNLLIDRLGAFSIAHTPIMPRLLIRLARLRRSDIVQIHVAQAYCPEMVWIASKLKGFKYIAHIHLDSAPSGPAGFLLRVYKPLVLKRVLRAASMAIVFTEGQRRDVHEQYGVSLERIEVVSNGVEGKFFNDDISSFHRMPRLLFVGRMSVQKNLPLLLYALEGISHLFETTIVGDGELEHQTKDLANELGLSNVVFAGRADGEELLNFYRRADVFVLPSEREGMPLVLLEAMAMALPIVATDVTGNRDLIQDGKNGILVPMGDIDAFRKALLSVVSDGSAYERLSRASRKMADDYSWDKVITKFETLYKGMNYVRG